MKHLTPNLFVNNIDESISFYRKLGFELIGTFPEQGIYDWVMMASGRVTIMLQTLSSLEAETHEAGESFKRPFRLHIEIRNLEIFFNSIRDKVTVLKRIKENAYGTSEFTIKDTDGYVITFAEDRY